MADKSVSVTQQPLTIPPDDPLRKLAIVQPTDQRISHIGVVGVTLTRFSSPARTQLAGFV